MKNLTKKFILENPTMTLTQAFKELFTEKLVKGKFYTKQIEGYDYSILFLFNGEMCESGYALGWGIDAGGNFIQEGGWGHKGCVEATHEETQEALIDMAKKLGYANQNYKCLLLPDITHATDGLFYLDVVTNRLHHGLVGASNVIMMDGKWAEILKTYTREEAEKILGGKVL